MPIRHHSVRSRALLASLLFFAVIAALTIGLRQSSLPRAQAQSAPVTQDAKALVAPKFVSAPNPYYRAASSRHIDTVVVHFISGINVDAKRWSDPQLAMEILKQNHVSAHYLVDRAGTVYRLVSEKDVAYQAGGSIMPSPDNRHNVNGFSIGIENIATAKNGFTDAQYRSLAYLIKQIEGRYPIQHIVGHDQIAGVRAVQLGLRKDVKTDPGPLFDWTRLHTLLR